MFKVGDKVEVKGYEERWDGKGAVEEYYGGYVIVKFNRKFPRNRGGFPPQYVHKIDNPSPIRTVTRREIIPGQYGRIYVGGLDRVERKNAIIQLNEHDPFQPMNALSAEELREAAHILNQLAEALEDKP